MKTIRLCKRQVEILIGELNTSLFNQHAEIAKVEHDVKEGIVAEYVVKDILPISRQHAATLREMLKDIQLQSSKQDHPAWADAYSVAFAPMENPAIF